MRRRDLFKSEAEIRADTLRRVKLKRRANLSEAAIILGLTQSTVRAYCDRGEIQTFQFGKLRYLTLEELDRAKGVIHGSS